MVKKDAAAGLQLVHVHKAEDGHVVLTAHAGGEDDMVVVNWCSSQDIDLAALLFVLLLLWLQSLLVPDKLLLHEVIVLDPLMTPATYKETITYKESVDSFRGSSHNKLTRETAPS